MKVLFPKCQKKRDWVKKINVVKVLENQVIKNIPRTRQSFHFIDLKNWFFYCLFSKHVIILVLQYMLKFPLQAQYFITK